MVAGGKTGGWNMERGANRVGFAIVQPADARM